MADGRCFIAEENGKIVGLAVVRPMTLESAQETKPYELNMEPWGNVLFCDLLISTRGMAVWKTLLNPVLARFGEKPLIAWRELKYHDRLRVHKMSTFRKAVY